MDDAFVFSKKGDQGTTSLLTGRRVSKASLRPEAYGTLDEASSALGLAKAFSQSDTVREMIQAVQEDLLVLGAQLSEDVEPDARCKYEIGTQRTAKIEAWIEQLQKDVPMPRRFILPGVNRTSAAIDMARTIVRRAERRTMALKEAGEFDCPDVHAYLNRLADFLFTLARYADLKEQ